MEGDRGSSARNFHVLTPPTSESGPISVPLLTNQIRASSVPEECGVVSQRSPSGLPEVGHHALKDRYCCLQKSGISC